MQYNWQCPDTQDTRFSDVWTMIVLIVVVMMTMMAW